MGTFPTFGDRAGCESSVPVGLRNLFVRKGV